MIFAEGPAPALLIALFVLGVVALLAASAFVAGRRAPDDTIAPPVETATDEAPPTADEAPPKAPAPPTLPDAAAPVEAPEGDAPLPITPSPFSPPPPPPAPAPAPVIEAPPVVATPTPAPTRRRVRPIGALRRLFRGSALTAEEWEDLEETLLRADVGLTATGRIVEALRARSDLGDGVSAIRAELIEQLGTADRSLNRKSDGLSIWLVTGVNGAGKTTTIGKLAAQLRDQGAQVVLAAADTFRAAADQQLEAWAERAGAQVIKHGPGADPAAVVFDGIAAARARNADVLIVDTAGRLQNKRDLMDELEKIRRVLEREAGPPDETLLVLDATTGQNGLQQARAFTEAATVTGIVLTKLDGSAKGGIVIAVQQELGIPVKMVGLGENIEDLAAFDPASFVDDLLAAEDG